MAMNHRPLGTTGENPSQLGFGCMRLPVGADRKIDFALAEKMIDYAYAHGVNYFDTAFIYHGGESETVLGKILGKYPRESFYVTTKLLLFSVKSLDDAKEMFNTQLARLNMDYIDNYFLHGINKDTWEKTIKPLGLIDYMQELRASGKIKHIGFSFHDDYEVFEEVARSFDWELCQIQYNYIDNEIQAGDRGVALCGELGIPLVIMEPAKGGALTHYADDIEALFKDNAPNASVASWAFRWVASHPEINVTLSGMSTMEQVIDNVATFSDFKPLDESEQAVIDKAKEMIKARERIGCTGCRYCQPCPNGIDIPMCFSLWNNASMFPNMDVKRSYSRPGEWQARFCQECGECEEKCPQHLNIVDALKQVEAELGN